ncbi:hypothetical protein [Olivibacter sitiensis]|uniref:hypothetical protein n=1 Tax=Olivibacter sitiensis TaxID=376470 RepID=UPI000489A829|nr:hypothetical protein [Olivibacter sitiensis]
MSERTKKIFLALCIVVPFLLYCVYYYSNMVSNAPFRFADFQSVEFNYGHAEDLENKFNSLTQDYQYLNRRDSLVHDKLRLRKDDLLYIHRKAMEFGFWNFPEDLTYVAEGVDKSKSVRFSLKLNYKEKSKQVLFDSQFGGDPRLKEAALSMMKEMERVLSDAEDRMGKNN